jgi:hypothetical protein
MIEFIKKHYGKIGMGFALAMLVINYFQQRELTRLRTEQKIEVVVGGDIEKANIIDSLHNELFIEKVQNGRYELTFEHLKEVNPKLGKEMEDWMSHETE